MANGVFFEAIEFTLGFVHLFSKGNVSGNGNGNVSGNATSSVQVTLIGYCTIQACHASRCCHTHTYTHVRLTVNKDDLKIIVATHQVSYHLKQLIKLKLIAKNS